MLKEAACLYSIKLKLKLKLQNANLTLTLALTLALTLTLTLLHRRRGVPEVRLENGTRITRPQTCITFKKPGQQCEGSPNGSAIDDPLYHAQCPVGHCHNETKNCTIPPVCDWDYECGVWANCPAADHAKKIQGTCVKQCANQKYCTGSATKDKDTRQKCLAGSCLPVVHASMSHEFSFSHLTSEDFNGWTKVVYQTAYGIAIGIYDTELTAYKKGCRVDGATSRRGMRVTFTASLSEAEAQGAITAAKAMSPAHLISGLDLAKASLGTSGAGAVVTPPVSSITISKNPTVDYVDTNTDGDTSPSPSPNKGSTSTTERRSKPLGFMSLVLLSGLSYWCF